MRGWREIGAFGALGLVWGSEWMVVRSIDLPPLRSLAIRYALAAVILVVAGRVRRKKAAGAGVWGLSAFSGATLVALPTVLTVWASGRLSPGLLVVILAMTPLIAALLEGRARGALLAPLVGGMGGTALLASQGLSFASIQRAGAAAALAAAISIAWSVIFVRRRLPEVGVATLAAIQLGVSAALLGVSSLAMEGRFSFSLTAEGWFFEMLLAVFGAAVAFPLYYWLLGRTESFELTAVQWVVTVLGVAEGLVLVREAPSLRMGAGTAIVAASLATLCRAGNGDDAPVTILTRRPDGG